MAHHDLLQVGSAGLMKPRWGGVLKTCVGHWCCIVLVSIPLTGMQIAFALGRSMVAWPSCPAVQCVYIRAAQMYNYDPAAIHNPWS
jgi:hypothetical protein